MRVELTEHLTDDPGTFLCLSGIADTKSIHSEKHSSLHRLEAVACIRERPGNDD